MHGETVKFEIKHTGEFCP